MSTPRNLWIVLFISVAVVGLIGDHDLRNGTAAQSQGKVAPLSQLPSGSVEGRNDTSNYTEAVVKDNKNKYYRKNGGGGGGFGWGWGAGGGGGGGGGSGGGWGWGWGGGGGGWYKWGCEGNGKGRRGGGGGGAGGGGGGGGAGGGGGGGGGGGRGFSSNHASRKRVFPKDDYKLGEFAQCTRRGRCRGMRLDCPLHCGGPCVYDCQYMCKAHCRRL